MKKAVFAAAFLVAVALVAFLAGCNVEKPTDPQLSTTNGSNPVSLHKEGTCGITTWNLTAGQTIDVGSVTVENDADNLYVTYTLDYTGACFGTLHLWVGGDLANVPKTKSGNPIPGQFPYSYDATGQTSYTFEIPLADLGIDLDAECENTLYVGPHAEVDLDCNPETNDGTAQTAFGGDTPGNTGDRWWFYGVYTTCCPDNGGGEKCYDHETAFAFDGDQAGCFQNYPEYLDNPQRWGWTNGPYGPGTYTWNVYAGAGQCDISKGTLVGTATLAYDGSTATVTYNITTSGWILEATHAYVGCEKFPRNQQGEFTTAPGQYGSTNNFGPANGVTTSTHTITGLNGCDVYAIIHAAVLKEIPCE